MNAHPVKAVGMGYRTESSARPKGDPNEVGHIYDFFSIDYEYANGVHMLSTCRQIPGCDSNVSEAVVGSKGTCLTQDHRHCMIKGEKEWSFPMRKDNRPYEQEHTDLIESIRSGKPMNELKNVAESTMTAIMGRMSAYTGVPLTWEQALNSKDDTMPPSLSWDMKLQVPAVAQPGRTKFA
jgi:myo-inositol 2-dehydrogenase/D-chiro-inositol 1-dehydrogenase